MPPSGDSISLYQVDRSSDVFQARWLSETELVCARADADRNNLFVQSTEPNGPAEPIRLTARGAFAGNSYTRDIDPFDISPDGRTVAFASGGKWSATHDLYLVDVDGGTPRKIAGNGNENREPRFTASGEELLLVTDRWSFEDIAIIDREGTRIENLTADERFNANPQPHPTDENLLAYTSNRLQDFTDDFEVRVLDRSDGRVERIAGGPETGHARSPQWSPDGAYLYYADDRSGHDQIYRWERETGTVEQLTEGDTQDYDPRPHPSEPLVAFTRESDEICDVAVYDLESDTVTVLTDGDGVATRARFSPTGKLSYVYSDYRTPSALHTMDSVDGPPTQRLSTGTPALRENSVTPEHVTFESVDGYEVTGLLYRPEESNGAGLVYIHGGPTGVVRNEWNPWLQFFTSRGFTVLAPNFRGSDGHGREHRQSVYGDWGGKPLDDTVAAADQLATLDEIDADQLGIWGQSYGGYMAIHALTKRPDAFAAGACFYGNSHHEAYYDEHDHPEQETPYWETKPDNGKRLMLKQFGPLATERDRYHEQSSFFDLEEMTSPIIIFQGLADEGVLPEQTKRLADRIEQVDKAVSYHAYEGQGHGFHGEAFVDSFSRAAAFFEKYLTTPPADP